MANRPASSKRVCLPAAIEGPARRGFVVMGLAGLLALLGCSGEEILRPLDIVVTGLSARAEVLVVSLFPDEVLDCAAVDLDSAASFEGGEEMRWIRSEGTERAMSFPDLGTEQVTIVAYSEAPDGQVLQVGCLEMTFAELGSAPFGRVEVPLSQRAGD